MVIAISLFINYFKTDDSKVFAWGNNEYGQLGLSPKEYGPQVSQNLQRIHDFLCFTYLA